MKGYDPRRLSAGRFLNLSLTLNPWNPERKIKTKIKIKRAAE